MKKPLLYIILWSCLPLLGFGQVPAEQENLAGFRSEWYGGAIIHTNGWGVNLTRSKFKTYKRYHFLSFDLVSIRDPKEFRVRYQITQNQVSRAYKFGKLNSLYNARFSFGQQYLLYEKLREKGVSVYFNWKTGASLGMLKPIYLEIAGDGTPANSEQRYDPEIHNESNIFGRGTFGRGFGEISPLLGGHIKTGFKFEFSKNRENITALEAGFIMDVFPQGAPIMAYKTEETIFYNFYLEIIFGKKYYD